MLLLAGRALAQDGGLVDRVQMGDNDLDCVQIAAQVRDIDTQLAPHSGDQGAVRGATESVTRSRTGEVVAGVAKVLPFGSIFGDIAKDVLGRRGREADARLASLRARKEYLVDMFLKRGCRVAGARLRVTASPAPWPVPPTPMAGAVTAPAAQIPTSVQAAVPPATPPGIPVPAVEPLPSATAIVAAQPPAARRPRRPSSRGRRTYRHRSWRRAGRCSCSISGSRFAPAPMPTARPVRPAWNWAACR